MRSRPVDLGLLGFETKSVKLGLAVGRNSIYWAFQSHIVKKKKFECEDVQKCRPSHRPVLLWIGVSYSLLLITWHGLKKDRISSDMETVVLLDYLIMEDELTRSCRACMESIAFTQKGRRSFAGVGRILDKVNGQSLWRLVFRVGAGPMSAR